MSDIGASLPDSPLSKIRGVERSAAERVEEATAMAAMLVAEAERHRRERVEAARQRGVEMADRRYRSILAEARAEAARIADTGAARANALQRAAAGHVDAAVAAMVDLILPHLSERHRGG